MEIFNKNSQMLDVSQCERRFIKILQRTVKLIRHGVARMYTTTSTNIRNKHEVSEVTTRCNKVQLGGNSQVVFFYKPLWRHKTPIKKSIWKFRRNNRTTRILIEMLEYLLIKFVWQIYWETSQLNTWCNCSFVVKRISNGWYNRLVIKFTTN